MAILKIKRPRKFHTIEMTSKFGKNKNVAKMLETQEACNWREMRAKKKPLAPKIVLQW